MRQGGTRASLKTRCGEDVCAYLKTCRVPRVPSMQRFTIRRMKDRMRGTHDLCVDHGQGLWQCRHAMVELLKARFDRSNKLSRRLLSLLGSQTGSSRGSTRPHLHGSWVFVSSNTGQQLHQIRCKLAKLIIGGQSKDYSSVRGEESAVRILPARADLPIWSEKANISVNRPSLLTV